MDKPLPCPFCGKEPTVEPCKPYIDGDCFGSVQCINRGCPARPIILDGVLECDDRGSDAYKQAAIKRWNRREG